MKITNNYKFIVSDKCKDFFIYNDNIRKIAFDYNISTLIISNDGGKYALEMFNQNKNISYLCLNRNIADITKANFDLNKIQNTIFTKKSQLKNVLFDFIYTDTDISVAFIKHLLTLLNIKGVLCIQNIDDILLTQIISTLYEDYNYVIYTGNDIQCIGIEKYQ